jgi:hypothetical protein
LTARGKPDGGDEMSGDGWPTGPAPSSQYHKKILLLARSGCRMIGSLRRWDLSPLHIIVCSAFVLLPALLLPGCAGTPSVVSQTPASIELKCGNGCAEQSVADAAQAHCRQYGRNARQQKLSENNWGARWVTYDCVP